MRICGLLFAATLLCLAACAGPDKASPTPLPAQPEVVAPTPEPVPEEVVAEVEEYDRDYGKFVQMDLVAKEPAKAAAFYEQLLGWTVTKTPNGNFVIYNQGRELSRIREYDSSGPIPAGWMSYISVENVDDLMRDVPANGGAILVKPTNAKEGRIAVLKGATDGVFGVVQLHGDANGERLTKTGDFVLSQLWTNNYEKAISFYSVMGDYNSEDVKFRTTRYSILKTGSTPRAIIRKTPAGRANRWIPFVLSDDVDGLVKKAKKLGAKIVTPARVIPTLGRVAVVEAPTGGIIGFIAPDNDGKSFDW